MHKNIIRWSIILSSFIIISLILWNTFIFFQNFKSEERLKMEIWSLAQKELKSTQNLDTNVSELAFSIITSNNTTPMINLHTDGSMEFNNIDEEKAKDTLYLKRMLLKFKKENEPIEVTYKNKLYSTLYYGNSPTINRLKFYPVFLLLIIFLFGAVVYFFYTSSKNAQQNKLWTGMAKETAHQIGTPLSSLVGWTEILKSESVNTEYISEIEKDINRLKVITDRFSKIGSIPKLEEKDIIFETKNTFEYLKARSSKLITFEFKATTKQTLVNLNTQLYSWTIENLVKNGIDAMKGKGTISISIEEQNKNAIIYISDTGKGISKGLQKKIFEPGYTTKKRGWGLGLSLAKRIIQTYHNGKIKVFRSDSQNGTIFQIILKKA